MSDAREASRCATKSSSTSWKPSVQGLGGLSAARLTRRRALTTGAAAGIAVLAGCDSGNDGGGEGGTETGSGAPFTVPDSGAKISSDPVSVRWMDNTDKVNGFLPVLAKQYHKQHSNVTVNYQTLAGADLARAIQLSLLNGTTPDVFRLSDNIMPAPDAVEQKVVIPLDDIVPNFDAWKAAFPANSFIPGVSVFDDLTYSFPLIGKYTLILEFNRTLMEQAGLDPTETPFTFDSFRAAAKKLTEQGAGKYYGFTFGGKATGRWAVLARLLASMAGATGGDFNYQTGRYNYAGDGYQAAMELILALKSDKSIDPATITTTSPQSHSKLPLGQSAMLINETNVVPTWITSNPKFDFDIAHLPVADAGQPGYVWQDPGGPLGSYWWVGAPTKAAPVVGDLFSYLGSLEGQSQWQKVTGGGLPVAFPKANEIDTLDERLRTAYTYFESICRAAPKPELRNPEVVKVDKELKAVTPDIGATFQGIYTGQIADGTKALKDVQDRCDQELDRAIAAAVKQGAKVTRDDYVFANWTPSKDYDLSDYKEL